MSGALDERRSEPVAGPAPDQRMPIAAVLDAVSVTVFVAAGLRSHEQDPALTDVFAIAAPFLAALAAGWLVARAWRRPFSLLTGGAVWSVTLAGGMVLRNVVFGRGTATSFVIVTAAFLFACLIGWRLVALAVDRARRR